MIDLARQLWDLLVHVMSTSPAGAWPLVLAMVGSGLITQRVKFWSPMTWPAKSRALFAQLTAFTSALGIVWVLWPTPIGFVAGGCIGICSPVVYAIAVRLIGMRWPWMRDLLSQDVRD